MVLQRVPQLADIPDATKNPILGEASLLRALSYHNLVKFWGDVPMPLEPVAVAADAATYTRTPQLQVYTQILADLDKAAQMITNTTDTRRRTSSPSARSGRAFCSTAPAWPATPTPRLTARARWTRRTRCSPDEGHADRPVRILFTATGANTAEDIFRVSFTPSRIEQPGLLLAQGGPSRSACRPPT